MDKVLDTAQGELFFEESLKNSFIHPLTAH